MTIPPLDVTPQTASVPPTRQCPIGRDGSPLASSGQRPRSSPSRGPNNTQRLQAEDENARSGCFPVGRRLGHGAKAVQRRADGPVLLGGGHALCRRGCGAGQLDVVGTPRRVAGALLLGGAWAGAESRHGACRVCARVEEVEGVAVGVWFLEVDDGTATERRASHNLCHRRDDCNESQRPPPHHGALPAIAIDAVILHPVALCHRMGEAAGADWLGAGTD